MRRSGWILVTVVLGVGVLTALIVPRVLARLRARDAPPVPAGPTAPARPYGKKTVVGQIVGGLGELAAGTRYAPVFEGIDKFTR